MAGTVYYTTIPKRKHTHGCSGSELTQLNFDKSSILKEIIEKIENKNYKLLFGEF